MADRKQIPFLILTMFPLLFSNLCYTTDTLQQGQQFKDWDELTSSNNVFKLKFFSVGSMVSPYLGIFYNINNNKNINYMIDGITQNIINIIRYRDDLADMAVWVANKNNPIRDIYGNLFIDAHGKLSILSRESTIIDLFSPSLVARNASVKLLDSGNLVLQELCPNGSVKRVLWQSFDYPTDTLLPGMKLGVNLKTGHRWSLNSWRSDLLPADGSFRLAGDPNGTDQLVLLRRGITHWTSGPWLDGEFKNTHLQLSSPDVRVYYVSNATEKFFTYLTKTYDSFPTLRMTPDGQLMSRTLNIKPYCGSINDPPGCAEAEVEKIKCREDIEAYVEYTITNYIFLDEYVYDESYNLTLYDCKRICWSNCSCVAYAYANENKAGCKTFGKMIYSPDDNRHPPYTYYGYQKKKSKTWIGLLVMIVPLALLPSSYMAYVAYKKLDIKGKAKKFKKLLLHQKIRLYDYVRTDNNRNAEVHYFTFQSISLATNRFSSTNKLGEGGFGEVYKGTLADGQEVAVKRLSKSSGQGIKEFMNEIELIAKLQHTNLVRLIGCCVEKQEKILVYEYMPNNSLNFFLFDLRKKGLLNWNNRFVIIDGIAQGLLYLHKFSRLRVIHRDLKASNILLDDYLKPKISDFGMAKLLQINESEAFTSRLVGTRGYMPPEYLMEGTVSTKIDVFGFGVLLLEIVSGRMNHGSYDVEHPLTLLGLAWELWNEGRGLELMDPVLEDSYTPKEVMTCIHVGLLCVQDHAIDRPTMSEVVSMLTNENMHLPEPKHPAFFIERHDAETGRDVNHNNVTNGSVNGQSISILVAR
ncbi:G-type lectin S-receptor-like serine/threonine-protein kinase CES101 [Rutidosis leptorrhynchoides]|uniref:G-type lectin S-receptor-like serine/threonine-protein kinase CES101 n=1 Tax=Rutidosis leptorrhynchoides TaxID=125765 RepID=UPI003A99EF85